MSTIAVLGTYDSKGHELDFVARCIATRGHTPLRIDVGTLDEPVVAPDIRRDEILDFSTVSDRTDRGACVAYVTSRKQSTPDGADNERVTVGVGGVPLEHVDCLGSTQAENPFVGQGGSTICAMGRLHDLGR